VIPFKTPNASYLSRVVSFPGDPTGIIKRFTKTLTGNEEDEFEAEGEGSRPA
jgi:hypothetical protein